MSAVVAVHEVWETGPRSHKKRQSARQQRPNMAPGLNAPTGVNPFGVAPGAGLPVALSMDQELQQMTAPELLNLPAAEREQLMLEAMQAALAELHDTPRTPNSSDDEALSPKASARRPLLRGLSKSVGSISIRLPPPRPALHQLLLHPHHPEAQP